MPSPTKSRPNSTFDRLVDHELSDGIGTEPDTESRLGNLADELADAFEEDGDGSTADDLEGRYITAADESDGCLRNGINGATLILPGSSRRRSLSPIEHYHQQHSSYDGSDYRNDGDLERTERLSPALEARMAAIEDLARRGTESNGGGSDVDIRQVIDHFKDLGSQSNIENGTSRLITTHTALTSHLSNQTRILSALTHSFTSPLSAPPNPEFIDDVLPLLRALTADLPIPTNQPLSSLHSLHASTAELTTHLTSLSDTLYMTRQTTSLAARRLRTATELTLELRRDAEASEVAVWWLQKEGWDTRLAGRECARVCGDVIGEFERNCNVWREKLLVGLEVAA